MAVKGKGAPEGHTFEDYMGYTHNLQEFGKILSRLMIFYQSSSREKLANVAEWMRNVPGIMRPVLKPQPFH